MTYVLTEPSINHLHSNMWHETVPNYHQMVSFDVKSLFTSVPLQETIDLEFKIGKK